MRIKTIIGITICVLIGIALLAPMGQRLIAQTTYSVGGWLGLVTDTTNDALQVNIVAQSGTASLTTASIVDLTVTGWNYSPVQAVTAQSYTISSSGKAAIYAYSISDTEAGRIDLPDTPTDGLLITVVDVDLNASANNIIIETAGSDTINEAANHTQNADGESTTVVYDSANTNWMIIGGHLE